MGSYPVQPLWIKLDHGVMIINRYSTLLKAPELEPRHQIV